MTRSTALLGWRLPRRARARVDHGAPGVTQCQAPAVSVDQPTGRCGQAELGRPDVVWHYTSITGLIGILKSKKLRLTHADYLNDPRERQLVYEAWDERLRRAERDHPGSNVLAEIGSNQLVKQREAMPPFCTSFSTKSDNMLLWVAYSEHLTGAAIGFRPAELEGVRELEGVDPPTSPYGTRHPARREGVHLRYGQDEVESAVDEAFDRVWEHWETPQGPGRSEWFRTMPYRLLSRIATHFKTAGWKQEEEWRLAHTWSIPPWVALAPVGQTTMQNEWQYDPRNPTKPFIELPFDPAVALVNVIAAPCASEQRVRDIVEEQGLTVPVEKSPTQYRC